MYKIVRFYQDGRPPRTLEKGVALEWAKHHCNDPKTRKEGVYFDGYTEI